MSPVAGMSSMRWGGGEAPVGASLSAASRPRGPPGGGLGTAGPGWPGRWGRHASQWRRWWASHQARGRSQPGKTQPPSRTARAVRWAGWTTRLARPDLQRLGRGAPQGRGQQGGRGPQPARQPATPGMAGVGPMRRRWSDRGLVVLGRWPVVRRSGRGRGGAVVGWRVTRTRVTAPSQASRRHASGSSGPAQPASPTQRCRGGPAGCPGPRSRSAAAGPHRSGAAGRPPGARRASSARASACALAAAAGIVRRRPGGPAVPAPPAGSGRPRAPAARRPRPCRPGSGDSHSPRRPWRRSARSVGALGVGDLVQMAQDPPQPRWVQPPGRLHQHRFGLDGHVGGQVRGCRGASTWAWATEISPSVTAWPRLRSGVPGTAPGRSAPQLRGGAGPQPQPVAQPARRSSRRLDSLLGPGRAAAVDGGEVLAASGLPPGRPAAAGPGPARPGRCRSAGPGPRGRPRRAVRAAGGPAALPDRSVECVFESMAATYQAPPESNHQNQICGRPHLEASARTPSRRSVPSSGRGSCQVPAWA